MALIGYTLPRHGAIFTAKMLGEDKKDARILDAGGGTGLGGLELQKLGFYNLDILDMNTAMLEEAQRKNCYRNITWDYLGKNRLPIAEDSYDAVVIFGAMGGGHANEDCLDEIVRIVRPGGYLVIVMLQCYMPTVPDLEYRLHKMESRGAWTSSLRAVVPDFRQGEGGIVFGLEISPSKYEYMAKWTFR